MNTARTIRRRMTVIAVAALCVLIAVPAYAAYEDSLKGYWKMDEFNRNDNFSGTSLNTNRWNVYTGGGSYAVNNDLTLSGTTAPYYDAAIYSDGKWTLTGDFDVQIDYTNAQLGGNSGSRQIHIIIRNEDASKLVYSDRMKSDSTNLYFRMDKVGDAWNGGSTVPTSDTSGKLRIKRVGSTFTAYEWTGSAWTTLAAPASYQSFSDPAGFYAGIWSNNGTISTHFDSFKVANEPVADAKGVNGGIANGATSVTGKTGFGNALNFNGTSDYVDAGDKDSFTMPSGFTASAWIYQDSNTGVQSIISKESFSSTPANLKEEFMFRIQLGQLNAYVFDNSLGVSGNRTYIGRSYDSALSLNEWHNVIMTYDGGSDASAIKIFLDGTRVDNTSISNGTFSSMDNTDSSLQIGSHIVDGNQALFFNGTIDDSAVWNRLLSTEEIKSIYRFGTEAFENTISTWNSTGTADWSSGWSATGIPTALKDSYVNSGTAVVSSTGDAAKDLYVGYTTGDSGAVSITTGDLTATNEYIGRTGTGSVTQTGGTNTIADTLYIGQNNGSAGTYNLQGGILKAHAIALGAGTSAFNFTGGTLKTYSFTGDLVIGDNAVIAPGSSPGIMDVYGEFVLNGTYQAELGGLTPGTEYDQIAVHGGNITLGADSIIELAQWNSFVPEIGDTFILMDWDEGYTFTDNGYAFDPGSYGLSEDWTLLVNGTQFEARYAPVPEPGCAFGLLVGFFVPGFRRLLKRRVRG